MTWRWVAANALNGRILADLPDLMADYPLRRSIGRYESATASLPLGTAPPDWLRATKPGASVLACYDDSTPDNPILWGGVVTQRVRDLTDMVKLTLGTAESYLDRRYVGTVTYSAGQNRIVRRLVEQFAQPGGLPFTYRYAITAEGDGTVRARSYYDYDDTTVYQRLTELMASDGGPEWTVTWEWSTDRLSIVPVVLIGSRIGTATPAGRSPEASYEVGAHVTAASVTEDYSSGKGANAVQAVSSGQGSDRPTSGLIIDPEDTADRLEFEHRWSPSTSITNVGTLIDYARGGLALLAPGAQTIALDGAVLAGAPIPELGADIAYRLSGAAFPGGMTGWGRCIAYDIGVGTITPILAVDSLEEDTA